MKWTTATTATTATTYTHMALSRDLIEAVDLGGKAAWEVMSSGDKTCEPFRTMPFLALTTDPNKT